MTIKKSRLVALLVLMLLSQTVWAQTSDDETDASLAVSAGAERKLAKGLHLEAEAEVRTLSDFSNFDRWTLGVGVDYKLQSWLKADMGYSFINRYKPSHVTDKGNTRNGFWAPRHRWYASLAGSYSLGRWDFALRERYQLTHAPLQYVPKYAPSGKRMTDEAVGGSQEHLLRSRLAVSYNIRHCKLEPGASIELHNDLSDGFALDEVRYAVSLDYKLSNANKLSLTFRYTANQGGDDACLLSAGYVYSF